MSDTRTSKDRLSYALERVATYRKDPDSLLPYARSMVALADEIGRLQRECANWKQLHDANEACIADQHRQLREAKERRAAHEPSPEPHVIKQIEHAIQDAGLYGISKCLADYITGAIADYRHSLTKPDERPDPYKRCQHDLLKPGTTIEVIDKWKAKCVVCIEFFDLQGQPALGERDE